MFRLTVFLAAGPAKPGAVSSGKIGRFYYGPRNLVDEFTIGFVNDVRNSFLGELSNANIQSGPLQHSRACDSSLYVASLSNR